MLNRRQITVLCFTSVLLPLCLSHSSSRQREVTSYPSYQSMLGVKKIGISYIANEDVQKDGLEEDTVLTDISLKFRIAGIPIKAFKISPFVKVEPLSEPGEPDLCIYVETFKHDGLYSYYITEQFKQGCLLERDPQKKIHATTWYQTKMGTVGQENAAQLRGPIKDLTDAFINAYLTMNPKK